MLGETRKAAEAAIISANAAKAGAESASTQMTLLERQTKATEETAKAVIISADTAKRSIETLRADVSVETIKTSEQDVAALSTQTVLSIILVNHGGTSARNARAAVFVCVSDVETRPFVEPTIPFEIPPNGGTRELGLGPAIQWLKITDFARIESGEVVPYIKVRVDYEDIFGKSRWVETGGHFHPRIGWQIREHHSSDLPPGPHQ